MVLALSGVAVAQRESGQMSKELIPGSRSFEGERVAGNAFEYRLYEKGATNGGAQRSGLVLSDCRGTTSIPYPRTSSGRTVLAGKGYIRCPTRKAQMSQKSTLWRWRYWGQQVLDTARDTTPRKPKNSRYWSVYAVAQHTCTNFDRSDDFDYRNTSEGTVVNLRGRTFTGFFTAKRDNYVCGR